MRETKVSIIMPTYNRGYIISKAIESVISQSYFQWELIIVDDGSTDNTADVLKQWEADERIHAYFMGENYGANYCRNYGISVAKSNYIAFIDSDVVWMSNKLEVQMKAMEESSENIALVFCKTKLISADTEVEFPNLKEHPVLNKKGLMKKNFIDTNTALVKKNVIIEVGAFDEMLPRMQEWELFIRILVKAGYDATYIEETLCSNYIQENSISKDENRFRFAMKYILNKHKDIFINKSLREYIENHGCTYIYGAGVYGECLEYILKEDGCYVQGFVVSDGEKKDGKINIVELKDVQEHDGIIVGVSYPLSNIIHGYLKENCHDDWIDGYNWSAEKQEDDWRNVV